MSKVIKREEEAVKESSIDERMTRSSPVKRQPLSALAKIALWASAVRAFSGLGGVVSVTLITGVLSVDMLLIFLFSVASVVILATRVRIAPLVSTLLTGYLLYLTFTQPFIVESLVSPKGPGGGIGKFIGMVLSVACAIIAFGSSAGATLEVYRHDGRKAPGWLPSGLCLVAGMIVGAIFIGVISQPPVAATTTAYTNGVPTVHLSAGSFSQSSVTISKGSKLLLVDDTSVAHDLFNGSWQSSTPEIQREASAPVVNNVLLNGNSATIGPFVTAGTYHILCTIHRGMELTIIVQ
jgi:plastocyanin